MDNLFNTSKKKILNLIKMSMLIMCIGIFLVACGGETVDLEDSNPRFPTLFVEDRNILYQPIFPTGSQLDEYKSGISERVKGLLAFVFPELEYPQANISITGQIIDENKEIIKDIGEIELDKKINSDDHMINDFFVKKDLDKPIENLNYIYVDLGEELSYGDNYLLKIKMTINRKERYYYYPFIFKQDSSQAKIVEKIYNDMREANNEKLQEIYIHPPIIRVRNIDQENYYIEVKDTFAQRKAEYFEYFDKLTQVSVGKNDDQIKINEQVVKNKYYGKNFKDRGIIFPEEYDYFIKDAESGKIIYQDKNSIYEYDTENEKVSEIFRQDKLDAEYFIDEIDLLGIKRLAWKNDSLLFMAYGHFKSYQEFDEKIGLAFYKYADGQLSNISFLELPITDLEDFVNNDFYYDEDSNELYIFQGESLYSLQISTGKITNNMEIMPDEYLRRGWITLWEEGEGKYSNSVVWKDLRNKDLTIKRPKASKAGRLIGFTDNRVIVGEYKIENTYEYLNGYVDYLYDTIKVYDTSGKELDEFKANDGYYIRPTYHNNQLRAKKLGLINAKTPLEFRNQIINAPEMLVADISTNIEVDPNKQAGIGEVDIINKGINKITIGGENYLELKPSVVARSDIPVNTRGITANLDRSKKKLDKTYYRLESKGVDKIYPSFTSAMWSVRDKKLNQPYTISMVKDTKEHRLFDSSWKKDAHMVNGVIELGQRPELPRGCEVTALSILLAHHLDNGPDKMQLAEDLSKLSNEYNPADKYQVDMHLAFAGSMYDVSKEGLGVYIEPIHKLAKKYAGQKAYDVTGISYEQVLTLVSKDKPVQVIIPNTYIKTEPPQYRLWKTDHGYMEILPNEHSVVVMGFDAQYTYFSNPSNGLIEKRLTRDFRQAWESMGSQALTIIDW